MKSFKAIALFIWIAVFGVFIVLPAFAADASGAKAGAAPGSKDQKNGSKDQGNQDASVLTYKPPLRGSPGGRIGGGTRGQTGDYPVVLALVPDHTGLTTEEQPRLYWFLSKLTTYPIEFSIIQDKAIRPLVETPVKNVTHPGVQCIRLADYGIRLKKGAEYQWYVALVPDPDARSKDIIAGGRILRVDLQNGLVSKLNKMGKANAPKVYARAGLWYDALDAVSELIAAAPADKGLRSERISLLKQVGLLEVADYEMKR